MCHEPYQTRNAHWFEGSTHYDKPLTYMGPLSAVTLTVRLITVNQSKGQSDFI